MERFQCSIPFALVLLILPLLVSESSGLKISHNCGFQIGECKVRLKREKGICRLTQQRRIISRSYNRPDRDGHYSAISKSFGLQLFGWLDSFLPKPIDSEQDSNKKIVRAPLYPEQYPATYDENTYMVVGEFGLAADVRVLLKNTQLESRPLQIVYDANEHGWNANSFHSAVDGKGAAIVVCKTSEGGWYGGYNPKGWSSTGGARPSVAAFLFYSKQTDAKYNTNGKRTFQKLRKVGGGGLACSKDDKDTGIWLGADGLVIPFDDSSSPRLAMSKLGTYFERGPESKSSLFPTRNVELLELMILVGVYSKEEDIPYSGAVFDFTSG